MKGGKICVSVCAETAEAMLAKIRRAAELSADIVEVRFDCLSTRELEELMSVGGAGQRTHPVIGSATKPVITTFRPMEQGGSRQADGDERLMFWNSASETAFCDVEEEFVDASWSRLWGERICSFHDFSGVPENLEEIFDRLVATDAENVKIAVQAHDLIDAIPVWQLLFRRYEINRHKAIPIAMGEAGKWTRILGLAHGASITYGSLEEGDETAPGQITARDLADVYRVRELDKNTKVYGVIGDPVSESLSPYMHNAAFAEAGVNAVFIPLLVKDLDAFMRRMVRRETREVELNFSGFAVTMPHKQMIVQYLDAVDPAAKQIGAVNTISIDGDKLTGFNTDAEGFVGPLIQTLFDLSGARVAILGAGGAARACIYALKKEDCDVTVVARHEDNAISVAKELGVSSSSISNFRSEISNSTERYDVIVNATPIGMKGQDENETPFTADELKGVKLVYDLVTRHDETPLMREAKKAGCETIGGIDMLIEQGARQFEIWTGKTAPIEKMRRAFREKISQATK